MSDFADGIAPQRYVCRRARSCGGRDKRICSAKSVQEAGESPKVVSHWSLDEGRWQSTKETNDPTDHPAPTDSNLFIGFKKLVDRGWDAVTFGDQRRASDRNEQNFTREAQRRWTGQNKPLDSDKRAASRDEAVTAARTLLRLAELQTLDIPSSTIYALFNDPESAPTPSVSNIDAMLAFGGACYFLPEIGDRLPSAATLCRPISRPPQWLSMEWFKHSPYSPIQVGAVEDLPGPPERWRAAFTDLMAVSLGRPMSSASEFWPRGGRYGSKPLPGFDWVVSLQLYGALPPLLPTLQSSRTISSDGNGGISAPSSVGCDRDFSRLADEISRSDRAPAILRLCRERAHAWNGIFSQPSTKHSGAGGEEYGSIASGNGRDEGGAREELTSNAGCQKFAAEDFRDPDPNRKSQSAVISTVKTSSTTRSMDGLVTTTTLVKHQYEDGREEEFESVHTTHQPPSADRDYD